MAGPAAPADALASTPVLRCGRRGITRPQMEEVQQLVTAHPNWTREALAVALCRAWDWRREDGTLNRAICQTLLRRLATRDLITLPRARRVPGARRQLVTMERPAPRRKTWITL